MELNEFLSESHRKRKQRRQWIAIGSYIACGILVLVGVLWVVLWSPVFRTKAIVTSGTANANDLTAIAEEAFAEHGVHFLGFYNMFAWPSSLASGDVAFAPQVAGATLSKSYLSRTINIEGTARMPFAIWCAMGSDSVFTSGVAPNPSALCYWFDRSGVLFAKAFDTEGNLLFAVHDYSGRSLSMGKVILPDRFIPNLVSILDVLGSSTLRVKDIEVRDLTLEEVHVLTYDGPDVEFSLRFPADDVLPVLQNLIMKPDFNKLQYVDFRTADRAYYQ